jgi:hypothetical protein
MARASVEGRVLSLVLTTREVYLPTNLVAGLFLLPKAFLAEPVTKLRPTQADPEFRAVLHLLRFCGALLINLAVAVIATTFLDTEVRSVIPTHPVAGILWKEIILSVLCAAFISFFMWENLAEFCCKVDLGFGCTLVCFRLRDYRRERKSLGTTLRL